MKTTYICLAAGFLAAIVGFFLFRTKTGYQKASRQILAAVVLILCALSSLLIAPLGIILPLVVIIAYYIYFRKLTAGMKADEGEWLWYEDFEADYAVIDRDESGCYVILSFLNKVTNGNFNGYETAYVGSSSTVHKEVHSVLNNKMMSHIYDDIQNGKAVYIKIVPADGEHIDSIQEKLITMYNGIPYLLSFKEVREKKNKQ